MGGPDESGSACLRRLPKVSREAGGADNPPDGLGNGVTHSGSWIFVSSDVDVDRVTGGLGLILLA